MGFGGSLLRFTSTFLYALEFCCAAIILGAYSYFLAVLSNHKLPIAQQWRAVEGLSGAGVVYTIFAVLLTCFLGGVRFFAFLGVVLDILFCGAFVAIAIMIRAGASSCTGLVNTPLGSGESNSNAQGYGANGFGFGTTQKSTYMPNLGLACRLNTAAFAVAVIGAVLFLVSALLQVFVARHHQKEKKYGPSPSNNYTSGSGNRKLWARKPKVTTDEYANNGFARDKEMGTVTSTGLAVDHPRAMRPSHESNVTGYTGSTIGKEQNDHYVGYKLDNSARGGYQTGPAGSVVNPYGYENHPAMASNF